MGNTEDDEYWESQHKKSNRPADTAFKQQRLKAWKPVVTIKSTIPLFAAVGVLFLIVGGLLYGFVNAVKEIEVEYTKCQSVEYPEQSCDVIRNNLSLIQQPCSCRVNFTLPSDYSGTVYVYYKLTNFYQNHRRYIKSRNDAQLRGSINSVTDCAPLERINGTVIAPCGLVANSLFNDTLTLFSYRHNAVVNASRRNIAWKSDHNTKFRNPSGELQQVFSEVAMPPNWQRTAAELDPSDPDNNGFQNEDFIVWMRTAALSTFRKLYRRIPGGLEKGEYSLRVDYNFPTAGFEGKKFLVLTTISWLGGRNTFLGIAYLSVGSISLAVALAFLALNALGSGVWQLRSQEIL